MPTHCQLPHAKLLSSQYKFHANTESYLTITYTLSVKVSQNKEQEIKTKKGESYGD